MAVGYLDGRPRLDAGQVERLLAEAWGMASRVTPLASERDQNWLVHVDGSPRAVAKFANAHDDPALVELQQLMATRLHDAGVPCALPVPTTAGEPSVETTGHTAWLIEYRAGRTLAEAPAGPELFADLGSVLGAAATGLAGFDHPAAHRALRWDLARAGDVLAAHAGELADPWRRALVATVARRYAERVVPLWPGLPHGVIHNDANDHNVLVDGSRVSALLDFGDAVHTAVVADLAIACAYAMLDRDDPVAVREAIVAGYRRHRDPSAAERAVLPELILTRLAVSVCLSAHQRALEPGNDYLSVSEAPAWRLLERLVAVPSADGTPT